MGRATSGVQGIRLRPGDSALSMEVVQPGTYLVTVTDGGYAKRTPLSDYRVQGRGGLGIKVANVREDRGRLVGALVTAGDEELLAITEGGKIIRVNVSDVRPTGRTTAGVILARPDDEDRLIAVTRNTESQVDEQTTQVESDQVPEEPGDTVSGEESADD